MVLRKGKGVWVYKKICKRCGELKNVGTKHSRICADCLLPHYRSDEYVKARKILSIQEDKKGLMK